VVRTEDDQRRAWMALLASGLMVAVLGVLLFVAGWAIWTPNAAVANRLNITFADPNITARFLTLCACAAVLMFAARKGPSWLAVACALACAVVVPLTFSRSGLALFIVSVVVAAVISTRRKRAFAIATGTLLVFAISTGVNPVTRDRAEGAALVLETMVTGTAHNMSTPAAGPRGKDTFALEDNRKYLIAAGVNMFVDHPLTGVGFGGYQHELVTNYKRYLPPSFVHPDTASHTAFVTVAAEEGVIGLGLFLAFLVWLGIEAFRARRSVWVQLPMVLMVPIVLYSQFEGRLLEEPYFWLCLALVYAAFRLRVAQPPALSRQPANRDAALSRLPK
jgi:O-antigen ligase